MKWLAQWLVISFALIAPRLYAQPIHFPHIATTGYGEVVAQPDRAQFSVRVVETTLNAEQAKAAVDTAVTNFIDQLKRLGVKNEHITRSNLSITPQYHYPSSAQPELTGYRAQRSVTVDVEQLSALNQYLDLALAQGINQIDNVQLKVSQQDKYQQQARIAAIKDAEQKAASLAKGFKVKLGQVWRIEYSANNPQPIMMRSVAMADSDAVNDSYQDATLVIRDRVDVIYQLHH